MLNTLVDYLRETTRLHGARPAVVDGDRVLTYSELDRRSNQVAHLLLDHGVSPGDRVALYLEKSIEAVVAVYAILKAGAAYVPLDPAAPCARLAYILGNCGVRVLLTGAETSDSWEAITEGAGPATLIVLNGDPESGDRDGDGTKRLGAFEVAAAPTDPVPARVYSQDLAYVLYTSGSTGEPKGVMLTHRNAISFVEWAVEEFGITEEDRLSSHAPLHFDLSILDLFAASRSGAAVVLVPAKLSIFPPEVARFIRTQGISIWYSVPSVLNMLVLRGGLVDGDFPRLRVLLFAGEVFPTKYLRKLRKFLPHVRLANLYGPTETNVCTWYEVTELPARDEETIPIGKAIRDVEVFAVTEDGAHVAAGEVGELLVRGPTVMRGYWADNERSRHALLADPRRPEPRDPVYRTGDLAWLDPSGMWRYQGRKDSQIKSRGYRIELGDIESTLNGFPGVMECAVFPIPDDVLTNRIKAIVAGSELVTQTGLVEFCRSRLPAYMVPEIWDIRRDALPKTSTGKIDRAALRTAAT